MAYAEFEFNLSEALLNNLVELLNEMEPGALTEENVSNVPEGQGVYQLFHGGTLVYIGKTDSEAGLPQRLRRHVRSIQNRQNLNVEDVGFNAVRIFVFTAMDLETQLIRRYGEPTWNKSGFGSNDPGRNRDRTQLRPEGFDARFPINVDRELDFTVLRDGTVARVLSALKRSLPYVFRFQLLPGSRTPHPDLMSAQIVLPEEARTVRSILESVTAALPPGWQATALPSRVLIYRENYDYQVEGGQIIARSGMFH